MAIIGRHGLPLAVYTHAANHHEGTLVQLSFDFYMIEQPKPGNLIGDSVYNSDMQDEEVREDVIEKITPHRKNLAKVKTQYVGRLRRCNRRRLLERFFVWIQWQRRLLVR